MDSLTNLRLMLHQHPELSGCEAETADRICEFFEPLQPDAMFRELGGNGLAIEFRGKRPGPTIMLRCELDALPIEEGALNSPRSTRQGIAHLCGHDGHMAIMAATGRHIARDRPASGRVILLFQPAEETGQGAQAVLQDPRFSEIRPDLAFALHNLPGVPAGLIVSRPGIMTPASRGMSVTFTGRTAHAALPGSGRSPARAMCRLIDQLTRPEFPHRHDDETAFVTVVGARLGDKAFGVAPGKAEIWATLRTESDESMSAMVSAAERPVRQIAARERLDVEWGYEDIFLATVNSPRAVEIVRQAIPAGSFREMERPLTWSEDFGRFSAVCDGCLFGMGIGIDAAELHDPEYRFPDALIPAGAEVFVQIVRSCLGSGGEPAGQI